MILWVLFWKWDIWRVDLELWFLCRCSPFHTVGQSHQKWRQCFFCEIIFKCFRVLNLLPWMCHPSLGIDIVSVPHVLTHCANPVTNTKYQFLFWPLQLSVHSQMWSSLHWRINCRNADTKSGALRPTIPSCKRMQSSGLLGVFDANISLKVTRWLTIKCYLVGSLYQLHVYQR